MQRTGQTSRTLAALTTMTAFAASGFGAAVTGRVTVEGRATQDGTRTIVYAERLDGAAQVRTSTYILTQSDKLFRPRALAIPVGSRVDFPNEDVIFHNVFSLTRPEPFDLGLYRAGDSKSRVFDTTGTYRVFCNIHPHMTAVILVLPTSYIVEADANGDFELDLPPGRYRITAWSERSEPSTTEIEVAAAPVGVSSLSLNESNFVQTPHKDKRGRTYRRPAYSPTRGP